jgi:phosphoglycolate phosphatase-like HAD superfamily hydrolase
MERKGPLGVGQYSAYVFDLDGTLFALPVDWHGVRADLGRLTGEPAEGKPIFETINAIVRARPDLLGRVFSIVESYELKAVDGSKPIEGALDLLNLLSGSSRLALVTLQGRMACRRILMDNRVFDLFETMVTREDSLDRAEQLLLTIRRLKVPRQDLLFVGDRLNDVASAMRARVDVALVGKIAPDSLKPNYCFPSMVIFGNTLARRP